MISGSASEASGATAVAREAPGLAPSPGNPRFPLFDSLRAIAALSVFTGHVVMATHSLAHHRSAFLWAGVAANGGVAIFFLISGFLLYRPFLVARRCGQQFSLRSYARRRVLRIVPAYWLALSLFLLAGLVSGVSADNWWIFYGFGQIYSFNTLGGGIGVAWTLCVEVTFYAVLPLFAWTAARLSPRPVAVSSDVTLLLLLSAASLLFRAHYSSSFTSVWVLSTLPTSFFWFALGMALALLSVLDGDGLDRHPLPPLIRAHPSASWLAALAVFGLSYATSNASSSAWAATGTFMLRGLGALFVLLPGVFDDHGGGLPGRALRLRWLSFLGLVSYAFYLYHPVVIERSIKLLTAWRLPHSTLLLLLTASVLTTGCAVASYYVMERPMMRLGSRKPSLSVARSERGWRR